MFKSILFKAVVAFVEQQKKKGGLPWLIVALIAAAAGVVLLAVGVPIAEVAAMLATAGLGT